MAFSGRLPMFIVMILFMYFEKQLANSVITDVRLVGGPTSNKGTIEMRIDNGTWETTCGTYGGIFDVFLICRQLGFTGASRFINETPYGQNSTPTFWLDCWGYEVYLSDCLLFYESCPIAGAASCRVEDYLGCFRDNADDRVFPGDMYVSTSMSISNCIKFCDESTTANYSYAGVEDGNACYCGEASNNYTRHGLRLDRNCQVPCAGDNTEGCGGTTNIAVFRIHVETVETTPAVESTEKVNEVTSQPSSEMTTMTIPLQTPTTLQQSCNCSYLASTLAVGILLAFATLYGFIITLIYLHLRRSNIALKQSVSDRVGQELDPYTSLDATTMKQPAYEDIKATRYGNTGHTNAIEGVEYGNQTIVKQTARMKKSNLGVADENTEPEYELPIVK